MQKTEVLIIGAGPAGLAAAGCLRRQGIPFEILEQSQHAGNSWRQHYDRLRLHTVNQHSHLPHLPFPDHYPQYVSRQMLVDYFEEYMQRFDIRPHFGEKVESLEKENGYWTARTASGKTFAAPHIVIATGLNRVPNRPKFKDEEVFEGEIIHSRQYRNPKPFQDKRVMVVGLGNTGAEIALDLSEHGIKTYLSVRGPVNIVPRDFLGNPTQKSAFLLAKFPNWLGDWIGAQVQKIAFGDLTPYGLQTSDVPPARQLRETGKTPVIDIGTVGQIKAGHIKVKPPIRRFLSSGVELENGDQVELDAVILATGYRARVKDFLPYTDRLLDQYGVPKSCIGEGKYEGLYFLGFDNYKPGGGLGVIHEDSKPIVAHIAARSEVFKD